MKRLFLASSGLEYIKTFVGREPSDVNMLLIPTAGNLDKDVWWIDKDRDVLGKMGFVIAEADIETVPVGELETLLKTTDIVYVAGGNTFYLLKQIRETGFDKLLTDFVNNGGMYAGASAGSLVAGLDIEPVASIDQPERVDGLLSTKGLGFVNIVPVPHHDSSGRTDAIDAIKAKYDAELELVLLNDDQAIVVEGDDWKIVESKRSELEHEWLRNNH